jgi:hypothetical protein
MQGLPMVTPASRPGSNRGSNGAVRDRRIPLLPALSPHQSERASTSMHTLKGSKSAAREGVRVRIPPPARASPLRIARSAAAPPRIAMHSQAQMPWPRPTGLAD